MFGAVAELIYVREMDLSRLFMKPLGKLVLI